MIRELIELEFHKSYMIRTDITATLLVGTKPFSAREHARLERNHFLNVATVARGRNIDQYLQMTHLLVFFLHARAHAHTQMVNLRVAVCVLWAALCQITSQTCCLTHQRLLVTSGSLPLSALTPTPPPFSCFHYVSHAVQSRVLILVVPTDSH